MTLLELMIAAGITAVSLVLLMGSLASVTQTGTSTEERSIAGSHLQSVMEEVGELDQEGLLSYQAPTFRGLRNERIAVRCVSTAGAEVALPVDLDATSAPTLPNPVEVRVTVSWLTPAGHPYQRRSSTLHRY